MKLKLSALTLLLVIGASGAFAATATLDARTITKTVLDTGMEVVVKEDHATPLVALDVWVKNGTRGETAQNNGISHFIEHMVFKGTAKRSAGQIDLEIENQGGTLGGATSKDWTHFYTVISRDYFESALAVVADTLTNPSFPTEELEKERSVVLEEMARDDMLPSTFGSATLANTAFTTHPYRFPLTGSIENVSKFKREDLINYFHAHYQASNMVVVVVGDVKPVEATEKIKAAFIAARGASAKVEPTAPIVVPEEPVQKEVRRATASAAMKHSYLMLGFHAPGVKNVPNVYAMDLLMTVLGDNGRGRLGKALAPFGIQGGNIQTSFLTQRDPGMISVMVLLPDNAKPELVEAAILKEFNTLAKTPVSDADLALAKGLLLGEYAFANETYAGQAGSLGFYSCIDSYNFAVTYPDEISKRTAAELLQTAARFFRTDGHTMILMRPREK